MRLFDPHVHMYSRTTDDYERMALAGVEVVVEPSFWLGSARSHPATFGDYFRHLLEFEPKRAAQHGVQHFACVSMNPKEANDLDLAHQVIKVLDEFLDHPRCVALGEVGFDRITDAEDEVVRAQLALARRKGLPVQVHLPHFNKPLGLQRTLAAVKAEGVDPGMVLLDHNDEQTLGPALDAGLWVGMSIYPVTKLSPERALRLVQRHGTERVMVHSAADWGPSDPLAVPRTVAHFRQHRLPRRAIEEVVWENPIRFFGQSKKLEVEL